MSERSELQELQKRLTELEQTYSKLKMWAGVLAACIAGIFGVSLFQIPKTVREAIEKNATVQAAQGFQQAIDAAKTNADIAAEGAKKSLQNAKLAEAAVQEMKGKWDTELNNANAAISQINSQLAGFQRQHATQVERLETDNKILMAQTVIQFFKAIMSLVPPNDPGRPGLQRQLDDAKKQLSDLQSRSGSIPSGGRSPRESPSTR
jgi:hypothetical protein